jgi:Rap1a immunity proteins
LDGEPHNSIDATFCNAYVSGFTDALSEVSIQDSLVKFPDEGLSSHQTIRVVELYLRIHPETLHKDAGDLVMQILREKFPVSQRS